MTIDIVIQIGASMLGGLIGSWFSVQIQFKWLRADIDRHEKWLIDHAKQIEKLRERAGRRAYDRHAAN